MSSDDSISHVADHRVEAATAKPNTVPIDAVRAAFWDVFHQSGELWFNYLGTPSENAKATELYWEEFQSALSKHTER